MNVLLFLVGFELFIIGFLLAFLLNSPVHIPFIFGVPSGAVMMLGILEAKK